MPRAVPVAEEADRRAERILLHRRTKNAQLCRVSEAEALRIVERFRSLEVSEEEWRTLWLAFYRRPETERRVVRGDEGQRRVTCILCSHTRAQEAELPGQLVSGSIRPLAEVCSGACAPLGAARPHGRRARQLKRACRLGLARTPTTSSRVHLGPFPCCRAGLDTLFTQVILPLS